MPGFCYWIPGLRKEQLVQGARVNARALQRGLGEILQDVAECPADAVVCDVSVWQNQPAGVWILPIRRGEPVEVRVGLQPELQEYRALVAGSKPCQTGQTHIGWYREAVPTPADLARRSQVPGYAVADVYGDHWEIPVARSPDNPRGNLAWSVRFTGGRASTGVAGPQAAFWEAAGRLWDLIARAAGDDDTRGIAVLGAGFSAEEDQFAIDAVLQALAINYRVDGRVLEVYDALRPGWLSQTAVSLMANAIVDWHARRIWEAAQKKTVGPAVPGGVSFLPGDPAGGPSTG